MGINVHKSITLENPGAKYNVQLHMWTLQPECKGCPEEQICRTALPYKTVINIQTKQLCHVSLNLKCFCTTIHVVWSTLRAESLPTPPFSPPDRFSFSNMVKQCSQIYRMDWQPGLVDRNVWVGLPRKLWHKCFQYLPLGWRLLSPFSFEISCFAHKVIIMQY